MGRWLVIKTILGYERWLASSSTPYDLFMYMYVHRGEGNYWYNTIVLS